ncbi:MAG: NUDIX domain-containing protein [Candidatus Rokubacteria bacterium]|nr:NUDIX domain-containing protein [Candidatus Rokubacteria bacterium]MBI3825182.1 NUDIX domain-containing protein [Candidatus Rokubacteria bacterium]
MRARFCLACGGRLVDAREGRHLRRRCRRCGWTFYDNPVPACAAVILRRHRVLLVLRARPPHAGTWDLPGGFLEAGEHPMVGLKRELREELGVGLGRARLTGVVVDRYGRGGFPVLAFVYRVTLAPGPIRPADDVADARWFPIQAIPLSRVGFPSIRRALRALARATATRS